MASAIYVALHSAEEPSAAFVVMFAASCGYRIVSKVTIFITSASFC